MGQSLSRLELRWNLLRVILTGLVAMTCVVILLAVPTGWWVPMVPIFGLGVVGAGLAVKEWKAVWIWMSFLAQAFLLALGLFAVVFGLIAEGYVAILLLGFTMVLTSEHAMSTTMSYSAQFSNEGRLAIRELNAEALGVSLKQLYARLARDSIVLCGGFVLSIVAGSLGAFGPSASILSDPSLYMVIAAVSLAALLTSKEE